MGKLTKKERERVLEAAELIATGRLMFCCHALRKAAGESLKFYSFDPTTELERKFGEFYEMYIGDPWIASISDEAQATRIFLLLTFAEVG